MSTPPPLSDERLIAIGNAFGGDERVEAVIDEVDRLRAEVEHLQATAGRCALNLGLERAKLRQALIERDALLVAGHAAYPDLPFESTGSNGLRDLLMHRDRGLSLACINAFNTSAWLGPTGMLAQCLDSPSRGHTCEVGDITSLVGGIAGRVGCTLYRDDCVVALLGTDKPDKPIGLSSFDGDPLEIASLIWAAADRGAELAASMRPDKNVQPLVCAVAKVSNR